MVIKSQIPILSRKKNRITKNRLDLHKFDIHQWVKQFDINTNDHACSTAVKSSNQCNPKKKQPTSKISFYKHSQAILYGHG